MVMHSVVHAISAGQRRRRRTERGSVHVRSVVKSKETESFLDDSLSRKVPRHMFAEHLNH